MEYRTSAYSNLVIEVDAPVTPPPSNPPSPIERIGLIFTFRERRSRFEVSENGGERRLVWERECPRFPLFDLQLFRSEIFNNRGDDDALFRYLSCSFQCFDEEGIDAEAVADALIERWGEIRGEANSGDGVFTMTVNLTMWYIEERRRETMEENYGMIPACGRAVTEMLKRSETEEGECAICLDELKKKKKKKKKKNGEEEEEEWALQMPCFHEFHGDCIKEWLSKSHLCPICRFQMPMAMDF